MNTSTARSQARTLETAENRRTLWTLSDLEFVAEFTDDRDEDLAVATGRTLYAISDIRRVLAERLQLATNAARPPRLAYDRGITDLAAWEASFA